LATPVRFPPAFAGGVRHFNAGRFFEAHEAFEELLDAVEADERWDVLVALIQTAVAYHKCVSGHPGTARMLGLAAEKLGALPDGVAGVDVGSLRARVREDVTLLARGGSLTERLRAAPPALAMRRDAATPPRRPGPRSR
jgi:predicted metal-dependent hydrolase